jgi:hypothetical protein
VTEATAVVLKERSGAKAGGSVQHLDQHERVPDHPNRLNELYRSRMYVCALHDYTSDSPTNLSFRAGDVIYVLMQQDSGWWDGVLDGRRGWFPSNYCRVLQPGEHINGNITP